LLFDGFGPKPDTKESNRLKKLAQQVTTLSENHWGIAHVYEKQMLMPFSMLYAQCEDDFKR
jgi:hypothetical protein